MCSFQNTGMTKCVPPRKGEIYPIERTREARPTARKRSERKDRGKERNDVGRERNGRSNGQKREKEGKGRKEAEGSRRERREDRKEGWGWRERDRRAERGDRP